MATKVNIEKTPEDLIEVLKNEYNDTLSRHKMVGFLMRRYGQRLNPHTAYKAADRFIYTGF